MILFILIGGLVGAREFPEIRVWHIEENASYLIYRTIGMKSFMLALARVFFLVRDVLLIW